MKGTARAEQQNTEGREIAAVDLGSNSFHMIVARLNGQDLHIVDRIKETVRLAAGLDEDRRLSEAAKARALACLQRFGQRLAGIDEGSVRAVGTNTLRRAKDARRFLREAGSCLGHPIEVISGVEEARLIHLGVARSLPPSEDRRLVVDIGGGSTELIVGQELEPTLLESLYMGCVSMTDRFFADGRIRRKRFDRAVLAARQELEPFEAAFRSSGWQTAIGASGSIRAMDELCRQNGWSDGLTAEGLRRLRTELIERGDICALSSLPGLSEDRAAVLAGGAAILIAVFESLEVERLEVAPGALREGLLHDLVGRMQHHDVRDRTVVAMAQRYSIDRAQSERVAATAQDILGQVAEAWDLGPDAADLLRWAATLHEVGMAIAHSAYHKHGAYILGHADLAGFSRDEQQALAALVLSHRRRFPSDAIEQLSEPWCSELPRLAVILRLAVLVHRGRSGSQAPGWRLVPQDNGMRMFLPEGWLDARPLTLEDLREERKVLKSAGFRLKVMDS